MIPKDVQMLEAIANACGIGLYIGKEHEGDDAVYFEKKVVTQPRSPSSYIICLTAFPDGSQFASHI